MKTTADMEFKRFDMARPPKRQGLRLLIQVLSFFDYKKHKAVITKVNMEKIKPPYLLLVNHNAFLDIKAVAMGTKMNRTNSVVAYHGFLIGEWLLDAVGCI